MEIRTKFKKINIKSFWRGVNARILYIFHRKSFVPSGLKKNVGKNMKHGIWWKENWELGVPE